jgi:hypothetical protein
MKHVGFRHRWILALWLGGGALGACSIDAEAHKNYRAACDAGEKDRGFFCIPKRVTPNDDDAGEMPDTGVAADSGVDSGPALDATVKRECRDAGAKDYCYPFDADISTSFQAPCRPGTITCGEDGFWSDCDGPVGPEKEGCDGVDNDCDGKTDEEQVVKTCKVSGSLKGACAEEGFAICRAGKEDCLQAVGPMSEMCNGTDDDCDGETDEGLDRACYDGSTGCTENATNGYDCVPASICAPGMLRCVDGVMQTECTDDVLPGTEVATEEDETPLDENCNGVIDEGFTCQNGQTFPCYTGLAVTRGKSPCKDGVVTCTAGNFGTCVGEVTPKPETCANENVDDDCDGTKDDIAKRGTSCSDVSLNHGQCKTNATWECQNNAEICRDGPKGVEVCDGRSVDENCDGNVDEGFDRQTDENNCGSCGNRCATGLTCCGGSCVNTVTSNAHCGSCPGSCNSGLTCCSSHCVNTQNDINNCGSCGKGCLLGGLLGCGNGGCL